MNSRKRRKQRSVSFPTHARKTSHLWWRTVTHEHLYFFPFKHLSHPLFNGFFSIELIAARTQSGQWFLEYASPHESLSAWPAIFDPEAPFYRRPMFFTSLESARNYAKMRIKTQYALEIDF